jgi:type IV pilus assembly protein PilX
MMKTGRYTIKYVGKKEQGMVLVLSLILLLSVTMIGVSSLGTTSLEEAMTKNENNRHMAFQAAEAALRDGERYISDNVTDPTIFKAKFTDACTDGLCTRREDDTYYSESKDPCATGGTSNRWDMWSCPTTHSGNKNVWNSSNSPQLYRSYSNSSLVDSKGVAVAPKYIIEFLGYENDGGSCEISSTATDPCDEFYRVTAFATGGTNDAQVMLQSIYQVSY